jgi:hypothetical protein
LCDFLPVDLFGCLEKEGEEAVTRARTDLSVFNERSAAESSLTEAHLGVHPPTPLVDQVDSEPRFGRLHARTGIAGVARAVVVEVLLVRVVDVCTVVFRIRETVTVCVSSGSERRRNDRDYSDRTDKKCERPARFRPLSQPAVPYI